MPSPSDFLKSFADAVAQPITKPITWPDSIPASHSIRQLPLYVRFWPALVAAYVNQELTGHPTDPDKPTEVYNWYATLYWYVIAATISNEAGEPVFAAEWPIIWAKHVAAHEAITATPLLDDSSINRETWQKSVDFLKTVSKNDDGSLAPPPPDYALIGEYLKSQYDNVQGRTIMMPLWDAAMAYNGWDITEAKNSEKTGTSVPSGVTP